MKKILAMLLVFSLSACSNGLKQAQNEIASVKDADITRIELEHFEERIEIAKQDENFNTLIELTAQMKIDKKYVGGILYGMPIRVYFYNGDDLILNIATGTEHTDVDDTKYYTDESSMAIAEQLSAIVGKYYGYDQ